MKNQKVSDKASGWIAIVGFMLIGGGVLFYNLHNLYESYMSDNYSSTKGVIVESKIIVDDSYNSARMTYYIPRVTYKYSVDNKEYENSTITLYNEKSSDEDDAKELVMMYPLDSTVEVFYEPNNPHNSLLIKDGIMYGDGLVSIIFGFIFFSIGFWLFIGVIRGKITFGE